MRCRWAEPIGDMGWAERSINRIVGRLAGGLAERRRFAGRVSAHSADRSAGGARRGEDGSVTAEFATVLPAVILVLGCCLGAVAVVGQQVRLADSAADAARSLARGDDPAHAAVLAAHAGSGVDLISERRGEFTCAILRAPSAVGPFAALGLVVEASSCALAGGL